MRSAQDDVCELEAISPIICTRLRSRDHQQNASSTINVANHRANMDNILAIVIAIWRVVCLSASSAHATIFVGDLQVHQCINSTYMSFFVVVVVCVTHIKQWRCIMKHRPELQYIM